MFRETIILLSVLLMLQPSDAIKCYRCSSRADANCADTFSNYSIPSVSCTQLHAYDLTPVEKCLKIKHKEAEGWVYERSCDRKDKPQYREAEFSYCDTDLCNTADNHRPKVLALITFLFTSLLATKLLRF